MTPHQATTILKELFERNGCLRVPNRRLRRQKKTKRTYKKGYEVRLVAFDDAEHAIILEALDTLNFSAGASFLKVYRVVQPIYGRDQFARFCREILGTERPLHGPRRHLLRR